MYDSAVKALLIMAGLLVPLVLLGLSSTTRVNHDGAFVAKILIPTAAVSFALTLWATALFARSKGYSGWYGLAGLLWVFGPFALAPLPDRPARGAKDARAADDDDVVRLDPAVLPPPPEPLMADPFDPLPRLSTGYQMAGQAEYFRRALVVPARVTHVGSGLIGDMVNVGFESTLYGATRPVQIRVLPKFAAGLRVGDEAPLIVATGPTYLYLYDPDLLESRADPYGSRRNALAPGPGFPVMPVTARAVPAVVQPLTPPAPAVDSMVVRFIPRAEDLFEAAWAVPPKRGTRLKQAWQGPDWLNLAFFGSLLLTFAAVFFWRRLSADGGPLASLRGFTPPSAVANTLATALGALALIGGVVIYIAARAKARTELAPVRPRRMCTVTLDQSGVRFDLGDERGDLDWAYIDNALETPHLLVLYSAARDCWSIRKASFQSDDHVEAARELIRRSIIAARERTATGVTDEPPATPPGVVRVSFDLTPDERREAYRAFLRHPASAARARAFRRVACAFLAAIVGTAGLAWGHSGYWLLLTVPLTWWFVRLCVGAIRARRAGLTTVDPGARRTREFDAGGIADVERGRRSWWAWSAADVWIETPRTIVVARSDSWADVLPKRALSATGDDALAPLLAHARKTVGRANTSGAADLRHADVN